MWWRVGDVVHILGAISWLGSIRRCSGVYLSSLRCLFGEFGLEFGSVMVLWCSLFAVPQMRSTSHSHVRAVSHAGR